MAITVNEGIKMDLFSPNPPLDSPLPVGRWIGSRTLTGDGTGGVVTVIFAPPSAIEAAKYLWSWEEVSIKGSGNNDTFTLTFVTAEPYTDGGGSTNDRILYQGSTLVGSVGIGKYVRYPYPGSLFTYIARPGGGLTCNFQVEYTTNTNAVTYKTTAWGYLWHPQARTLAGGAKRFPH